MSWSAGEDITAAKLNSYSPISVHTAALTDITTTPTDSTYTDWADDLTITDPGHTVAVMVCGSGHVVNDGTGTQNRMRVGISTDGGSTFDWGVDSVDQAGGGASTRRGSFSPVHGLNGVTPTGDIVVRAQAWWAGTGGTPEFYNGSLVVLLIGQAE